MKVYWKNFVGDVPDGSVCMEIGAIFVGDSWDHPRPIVAIDWERKTYRREDSREQPFPLCWHRLADVEWQEAA